VLAQLVDLEDRPPQLPTTGLNSAGTFGISGFLPLTGHRQGPFVSAVGG
jgi:hypothetical protein